MALTKMVDQIEIKSDGEVFLELFRYRPHNLSTMSPDKIKSCILHEGEWGTVGSVLLWNLFHDGKELFAKDIIEAIDELKKSVTFKVLEGDLLKLYKTFLTTVQVETKGENTLVTWTFEYEKLNEDVPNPNTLMDFHLSLTKDIETHLLEALNAVSEAFSTSKSSPSQEARG